MKKIIIDGKEFIDIPFEEAKKHHGFIYVTVNLIDDKKYIGQHSGKNEKYLGSGVALSRAIKKHGKDSFIRYIIDTAPTQENLNVLETHYINDVFNAVKNRAWYNLKDGGQGIGNPFAGKTEEELLEIRNKISNSLKGKNKGKVRTEAERKRISEARKGCIIPEHQKEAIRRASIGNTYAKGMVQSEETKRKISEACKGKSLGKRHYYSKRVKIMFNDKTTMVFGACKDVDRYFNLSNSLARNWIAGLRKSYYKYNIAKICYISNEEYETLKDQNKLNPIVKNKIGSNYEKDKGIMVTLADESVLTFDNVEDVCSRFGISKTTAQRWLRNANNAYLKYGISEIRYKYHEEYEMLKKQSLLSA